MEYFKVFKDKANEWRFSLYAKNGEIVLVSQGYTCKRNCLRGIKSVKKHSLKRHLFEENKSTKFIVIVHWWFNLKAANGKVIGTSEMYGTHQAMVKGIRAVQLACSRAYMKFI